MDILKFLNTLENTLENITVNGRKNLDRLMGCFIAIDEMRSAIMSEQNANNQEDGDEDGRQVDNGAYGSDNDNAE